MIERKEYLNQIQTALGRSKVTAILGPRQCGKTTIAKEIASQYNSYFLDLESPSDRSRLQAPEIYLKSLEGLIIIDEIQLMPELFPIIRVLSDQHKGNGRFLILGNASPDLVKNTSESLAGRVEFVDLHGFNLKETGKNSLKKLWLQGGFPLSFLSATNADSLAWREGFIRTFLQMDIPQLGIGVSPAVLRRFWTMLAHSHGQILNSSQLAKSMGMSDKTIRSYIDILSATYMVHQLQPWFSNIKKRQVKSPKIYLTDSGILHSLLGINTMDTLFGHPQLGASWEGFVIEQITRTAQGGETYFWSTYSGAEIDLLLTVNGRRIGIECKLTETPKATKSMYAALKDLELSKLYIIYPGEGHYPINESIDAISLPEFLEILNNKI